MISNLKDDGWHDSSFLDHCQLPVLISRLQTPTKPTHHHHSLQCFDLVADELVSINKVTLRRARLVLGWVTMSAVQLTVQETYLSI